MFLKSDIRIAVMERIDGMKNSLANGSASSYPDYQHAVGYIQGLNDALDIALDVISNKVETTEDTE